MKKCIMVFFITISCFMIAGCTNVKVIKDRQKTKNEVISYVTKTLKEKYENIDIKLDSIDKAYTDDNTLIKKAKSYKFKIKDKVDNIAYAYYRDAFKIDKEEYDSNFYETYKAIYNNKELKIYDYLVESYIDKNKIIDNYYTSDFKEIEYASKPRVVYKLNYKINDMSYEEYMDFIKLGYDLRKYRVVNYPTVNHDDPEVSFIFKGDNKYYNASYYGLIDENNNEFIYNSKLNNKDYTDIYNLKSYINFNVSEDEKNKMIDAFNKYGKYLITNIESINVSNDKKYGYLLINNYTKNNYLLSVLIKFKFDTKTNSYLYDSINLSDNNNVGNFDGFIVRSW